MFVHSKSIHIARQWYLDWILEQVTDSVMEK